MNTIELVVNANNPGEYLAVCGVIELVSRRDSSSTSKWLRQAGVIARVPQALADVCEISTHLSELEFASGLAAALGSQDVWRAVTQEGRVGLSTAIAEWAAGIEFALPGCASVVVLDHWYERCFVTQGRIVQKAGNRDGKSRWKFWAGKHDSLKGATGLLLDLVDGSAHLPSATRVQEVLEFASSGASGLKLDPVTTRSAVDRGISANDAADEGKSVVRPCLELLAAVGATAFFPPRRYGDAAPRGTVGVADRVFRYHTWNSDMPICLARLCARGVAIPRAAGTPFEAVIGMMGQYSYLRFARTAGTTNSTWNASRIENEMVDEDEDE